MRFHAISLLGAGLIGAGVNMSISTPAAGLDALHDGLACAAGYSCKSVAVGADEARLVLGHDSERQARATYNAEYGWYRDGLACAAGLGCPAGLTSSDAQIVLGTDLPDARIRYDHTFGKATGRQPIDDFRPSGVWQSGPQFSRQPLTASCDQTADSIGGINLPVRPPHRHEMIAHENGDLVFGGAHYSRTRLNLNEVVLVMGWACDPIPPDLGDPFGVPLEEARVYYREYSNPAIPYTWLVVGTRGAVDFEYLEHPGGLGVDYPLGVVYTKTADAGAGLTGPLPPPPTGARWPDGDAAPGPSDKDGRSSPPLPPLDISASAIASRLGGVPGCDRIEKLVTLLAYSRNENALEVIRAVLASRGNPQDAAETGECLSALTEVEMRLSGGDRQRDDDEEAHSNWFRAVQPHE